MFRPAYNFHGGGEPVQKGPYTVATGITVTQGMGCMLSSGEVTTSTTSSSHAGFAVADAAAGAEVYLYDVSTVMAIVDANARIDGASLDFDTGAQAVTSKTNDDVVVVRTSTSSEDTLVMIHPIKTIYYTSS